MFDHRERFCPPKSVKEVAEGHKVCLAGIKPVQTHRVGFDQVKACSIACRRSESRFDHRKACRRTVEIRIVGFDLRKAYMSLEAFKVGFTRRKAYRGPTVARIVVY